MSRKKETSTKKEIPVIQDVLLDTNTGHREDFQWPNMQNARFIAIDTETTGLDEYGKDRIFAISIANKNGSWYIPIRANNGAPNQNEEEVFSWLKQYTEDPKRIWIFFNPLFDLAMFKKEGIEFVGRLCDLGVLASLQQNTRIKLKLKQLARMEGMETAEEFDKTAYIKKNRVPNWSYIPDDIMSKYAKADAKLTFDLFKLIFSRLNEKEQNLYSIESRETKALFYMIDDGIGVDCDYYHELAERYLAEITKIQLELQEHGIVGTESATIADFIRREGIPVKMYTKKTGQISTEKAALEQYDHPVMRKVQEFRRVSKLYSTYAVRMIHNQIDGVIHPEFWQTGAVTGRMSADLQQIPKKNPEIKRGIVPKNGKVFFAADYSQQEVRLLAHFSHDPFLVKSYKDPYADLHQLIADLLGIDRQKAKTLVFSIIYGSGREKVASQMGVDIITADKIRTDFYARLTGLKKYRDRLENEVRRYGYISNLFGRRYTLPARDHRHANYQIQGSGSDILKNSHARLYEEFTARKMAANVVLLIHDEIIIECPEEELDDVAKIAYKIMPDYPMVSIPMIIDAGICRNNLHDKEKFSL